jgi:predicted transcriptional regulator
MTAKAEVLQAVGDMPDNASYEEIARRIDFIAKVKRGMEQAARGEGTPVQEVIQQIPKWISQ